MTRPTRSVCPRCLRPLPAVITGQGERYIERTCPDHGFFREKIWSGKVDFESWVRGFSPLAQGEGERCPQNCGLCPEHEQKSCCVLLEVTGRCNLRCRFCFAQGGAQSEDPSIRELEAAIREIAQKCDGPLLQFSGGEPTLRDDLPGLVRFAKEAGCTYVQLNTNGIRLAREPEYARALKQAGLDIVFLQFDGVREEIYETLRGEPLLEIKKQAIRVCSELGLGVTLVPTVVPGVNTEDLGDIVRFARENVPAVRGVHFQPVSYFGRYPGAPKERYTLDDLMADLALQGGLEPDCFLPSKCDHPLCGFHASFLVSPEGKLRPMTSFSRRKLSRGSHRDNREYVARNWRRQEEGPPPPGEFGEEMDFDTFLYYVRNRSLTVSAMAFQDAGNLNVERLRRCTLHVYEQGKIKPFCARYLTAMEE